MKRTNTFFIMAALLLAGVSTIVSCTKDDEQPVEGKTYHMTVTASKGGDNAKALTDNGTTISATWTAGDKVSVYNVTKGADLTGNLAAQSSGASTTLKGTLTGTIEVGDELLLKFCSPNNYFMQDGTLEYIAAHCDYAEATVNVTSVEGGKITASDASFVNQQAIVKFSLMNAGGTAAIRATALSVSVDGTIYAAVPARDTNVLYVALPEISGEKVTLSAKVGDQWYNKTRTNVTFVKGQYYTVSAGLEPKGMLPGTFSVSSTSKVHFSQGNLRATYDGSSWTWAFAANQYDFIGNAAGNTKVTSSSPYIDGTGTVDLFGWVGNSSNWTDVSRYGITASTATNNVNGYGNVAGEALKADWANLAISNGGNTGWHTLTGDSDGEWDYLFDFNTRTASTVGGTDNGCYAMATVAEKEGIILFPDSYTHPADVTDPASVNTSGAAYTVNSYDADKWSKLEAAGAVFLPVTDRRKGSSVGEYEHYGFYWSSSSEPSNPTLAYVMQFVTKDVSLVTSTRRQGFSVRLVCPVE